MHHSRVLRRRTITQKHRPGLNWAWWEGSDGVTKRGLRSPEEGRGLTGISWKR